MLRSHKTPSAMARVLVQYMDDPKRIRAAILDEFNDAPSVESILAMRARFLRPSPEPISFKRERDAYAEQMARSNASFVCALQMAIMGLWQDRAV